MTPNEFKNLYFPYNINITSSDLKDLEFMFENYGSIEDILDYANRLNLPLLSDHEIAELAKIWKKLVRRRFKNSIFLFF